MYNYSIMIIIHGGYMLNIDVNRIGREDAIKAHALILTLRHFNRPEDLFSIRYEDGVYSLFIDGEMFDFESFDLIPMYVISSLTNGNEEYNQYKDFYNTVIKLGFNYNDALEYLRFHSEPIKQLSKVQGA